MDSPEEPSVDPRRRRRICTAGCGRPKSVCLCHTLPSTPLTTTASKIVILHHPHERRHRPRPLQMPPELRDHRPPESEVRSFSILSTTGHAKTRIRPSLVRALYLFPGTNALPLWEVNQAYSSDGNVGKDDFVPIVFDGTWKHAKEMVVASLPFISKFAVQVCLDFDVGVDRGTIFYSELILGKEPFAGCMSTMEAIARCLRVLEPNGIDIETRIIEVLKAMVSLQAGFLKPMKPRPKLVKNSNGENKENGSAEFLC